MSCELWDGKLDAYVDGEGSHEDRAAVEGHLITCADCAREALGRMQLKRATQLAAKRYSPSPEFRLHVQQSLRKDRKPIWSLAWRPGLLAAAALLLLAAASALVFTRHVQDQQALAEIADTHVATLASANPVDVVSTDRHTVKPWFQGKLPFSFNLPEFAGTPFKLVGGKVAYLNHNPAAQLLVASGRHQISVFISEDRGGSAPAPLIGNGFRDRGFNFETWTANGLRYIAVSDTNSADIHALAEQLRAAARK